MAADPIHRAATPLLAGVVLIGMTATVRAHEFWLAPDAWSKPAGQTIHLTLKVGHGGDVALVPRHAESIVRFDWIDAAGTSQPVAASSDPALAGEVVPGAPGHWIAAYESRPSFLALPGPRFEKYLQEEGLDQVIEQRAENGQSERAGFELFSRHAKALIRSGPATRGAADRPIGLECELIAESDLSTGRGAADVLCFRLLLRSKPLAGARVALGSLDADVPPIAQRSAADGRVRFPHPGSGRYLVSSVHMEPAADDSHARWRSYWASLGFEVPNTDGGHVATQSD